MTRIKGIAHQMIAVTDFERSIAFYRDVLGMECMSYLKKPNSDEPMVAFMSFGSREHDIALTPAAGDRPVGSNGSAHTAFEIDGGPKELHELYLQLQEQGVQVDLTVDHQVSNSLYLMDPDGNRIELLAHMMEHEDQRAFRRGNPGMKEIMRPLNMDAIAESEFAPLASQGAAAH